MQGNRGGPTGPHEIFYYLHYHNLFGLHMAMNATVQQGPGQMEGQVLKLSGLLHHGGNKTFLLVVGIVLRIGIVWQIV